MRYRFGEFRIDCDERSLEMGGDPVPLTPKAFDTLAILVRNAGKVLSKERLMTEVWQDAFVEENNLAQNISILRKALGEDGQTKYIETVPKFGYRFVADVTPDAPEEEVIETVRGRIYLSDAGGSVSSAVLHREPGALPQLRPETHYVQNGDVNIAYQVVGNGPIDLVFVMGWISHLEYFWKHHTFASFLEKLASFSRLILFDKRGTGLSDRVPNDKLPTLEQRMEDVHAVMNEVRSEEAILFGVSEGGPMSALFAATYPEMTKALVMFGTYAKRLKEPDYPWAPTEEQRQAFYEKMMREWGGPVGLEERAPSMANDPEFRAWWAEYLRMGASPGAAVALTKMNAEIDVRHVLPLVRVPTLVMHRKDDKCLLVDEGRYVASMIPGSKLVEFEGIDHLPFVADQDEVIEEIRRFIEGLEHGAEYDTVLATVMSIQLLDREGFLKNEQLAERTRRFTSRQLAQFKGREVSYGEGRILATFDGPARAIRCAASIAETAKQMGVRVKAGLHTGECDVRDGRYGGLAVELAKLIAGESAEGGVAVSRTVKDLVAGSGLAFEDIGLKKFDGVEGEWRLFSVK